MELAAIRHFEDKNYCYALEKGRFLIRLEGKRGDLRRVRLHVQEKYLSPRQLDTRQAYDMELSCSDLYRDYFQAVVDADVICLRYYFQLEDSQGQTLYYGGHGFYPKPIQDVGRMFDCPQTLREAEAFSLPDWAKNKVVYQIFPSRFATDKKVPPKLWYQAPIRHNTHLQGSLRGIINRLDYLQELGAQVLYLTPIFRSQSSHKYDTDDYYTIDPSFGTKEDLKELVRRAHSLGMYVILDGVFNHTSTRFFFFFFFFKNQAQSKYRDWYYVQNFPLSAQPGQRPNYKTFGYMGGMPKLNLQNEETADFAIRVAVYWIEECDIDGWRLDVADEIGHDFWRRFRQAVKAVKPQALLVGEVWHYAGDFLEGDQWDTVMNYSFCHGVHDLVASGTQSPSAFLAGLHFLRGNLHQALEGYLWNFIDTHDTARFLHSAGGDSRKQRLAAALQLLLPGMPMICYGDEVGIEGGPDPDCRRGMLWDPKRQNHDMLAWYQKLICLRRQEPILTQGDLVWQQAQDRPGLLAMKRRLGGQWALLVFHTNAGILSLPELSGQADRLSGQAFPGILESYGVALLMGTTAQGEPRFP